MKRIVLAVLLAIVFVAGLFAQSQIKTKEQLLQDVEKAHRDFLAKVMEIDQMFPDKKPMASQVEREYQKFLKSVHNLEAAKKELDELNVKLAQSIARGQENMRQYYALEQQKCTQARSELSSGRVNPALKDIWQTIAHNCDAREAKKASTARK